MSGDSFPLRSSSDFTDHNSILNEFTSAETKRVVYRVDRRLVSTLGVIYCISLILRLNMGNANVAGMRDNLDLAVGTRYSTVSLVFHPTFILFQIPVVPTIRYVGPRLYLTGAPTTFSALIVGGGFVTT
ncbi:hypothetical protein GTA08_BOTSDO01849 [Neofusicoccum parvum]|uniref:Uncharacterized protein n=1 Tax=Neofusicoccum parvum TaxID=310453 RepID=A0ACB5S948_9PEZI|nr:hypothetical protein GTA08_BOTSDO01849 [Neofusicoccum parvum]